MNVSKLTLVSYGIVAANKPLSSLNIEVTPAEDLNMSNGELTDNIATGNIKGKDADGSSFETTVKSSVTVTARWLPFGSNRKTAPDVRRGEKVCIWKYADADKYYWSELEYDGKLRKLETIIFMISATQDESAEPDFSNTYWVEWSTHNKLLHIHTSTSDGEPFGYDLILNTKDGNFQFRDTIENLIFLDSEAKRIVLKNAEGTFMDLNAANLLINVVGDMTTHVGGNMSTIIDGSYDMVVAGKWHTKTSGADFTTPQLSTSMKFSSGSDADVGGALSIAKGMKTGASGSGGDIQLTGNITGTGNATFSGRVKASNVG